MTPKEFRMRGFTLVEMLIVLAISAVVGLIATQLLSSSAIFMQRSQTQSLFGQEADSALDVISRSISSADPQSFSLTSDAPNTWSHLRMIAGRKQLEFYQTQDELRFSQDGGSPSILAHHLRTLQFVFRDSTDPSLVYVVLELEAGSGMQRQRVIRTRELYSALKS